MAGLRPGKIDREVDKPAYTRREFVRGVPGIKVVHYDMGARDKEFPVEVSLSLKEDCQIRHNALEAARVVSNRFLEKRVGKTNYYLKIRVYPHIILRQNRMATGKKADRYGDGMKRSFGKAVGTAARVKSSQKIMSVWCNQGSVKHAKTALRKAGMKFPYGFSIDVESNVA